MKCLHVSCRLELKPVICNLFMRSYIWVYVLGVVTNSNDMDSGPPFAGIYFFLSIQRLVKWHHLKKCWSKNKAATCYFKIPQAYHWAFVNVKINLDSWGLMRKGPDIYTNKLWKYPLPFVWNRSSQTYFVVSF